MASAFPNPADAWATTWARILDHCADVNGAPLIHAHRRAGVLGPRAVTPGVAATTGVSSTASVLQRRRVESLVLGALSSSPVYTACSCVGIGDQHIAVYIVRLFEESSSAVCSLSY